MPKYPDTAIFTAYDDHQHCDSARSERNLMRAVLLLAMDDVKKSGEAQRDALRFFASNNLIYPYSFLNICYYLNLCPKTIRAIIGMDRTPSSKNSEAELDQDRIAA